MRTASFTIDISSSRVTEKRSVPSASPADIETACALLESVGKTVMVDEKHMDAVTGLSASGPAFIYIILESLAEAGVKVGLPRETATLLAAQTALGAAKVCTPATSSGGTMKAVDHEQEINPWEAQSTRADLAAQKLNLDPGLWKVLRYPDREIVLYIPVQMDDGRLELFTGYRVQHSISRGPAKGGIRYSPLVIREILERH